MSSTEYLSRGAWTQSGAQYGTFQNFNYSLEAFYRSDPGQRVNNDIEERQLSINLKQQLTPQDTLFVQAKQYEATSGDVFEYFDQRMANRSVRVSEKQEPIVGIGYHHEWGPGVHTLVFGTRLDDTVTITNQAQPTFVVFKGDVGPEQPGATTVTGVQGITIHEHFRGNLEIYSGELQQIWQTHRHNTVVGARFQYGHFQTETFQNLSSLGFAFPDPPEPAADQDVTSIFKRFNIYGYHQWEITDELELIGGISYDRLTFPENFRTAPVSAKEQTIDDVLPKAGLIWHPAKNTTARFAYTRSLSGASLDQSYQLEPSQVAGFIQSFRSIIPESVAGANVGAKFENYGLSIEQNFETGTYLGLSGELLNSELHRTLGAFDLLTDELDFAIPSGIREHLDFEERSLIGTFNQLVSKEWSFGARYRISEAVLNDNFVDVPKGLPADRFGNFEPKQRLEGVLQQVSLFAIFNHPLGFFGEGESVWYGQDNRGYGAAEPGDDFWQFNLFAGYRFPRRRAELMLGLLNLADQNYRLNPLNLYNELPRERTLLVRLRLNF